MTNLPAIQENKELTQAVNARELHTFLESKQQFADWIKNRVYKYDFIEGQDFLCVSENYETQRSDGQRGIGVKTQYYISVDMAKELSMVENNEQGKLARKYFITCEKELREKAPALTQAQMLHQMTGMWVEQERKNLQIEQDIKEIKATQSAIINNTEHFATMGFARSQNLKLTTTLCAKLSRKCTALSKALGVMIGKTSDTRYGTVNTYHKDVLSDVFSSEGLI